MYKGTLVALPTPFQRGEVDLDSFRKHAQDLISAGIRGLCPCGTTGESPVLSDDEHRELIAATVEVADGKVPVIAGTGSNDTRKAIRHTKTAKMVGAQAALVVTPYYNRPSQEGLYRHYMEISEQGDLPMVLYSVPSRTGVAIAPETVARLQRSANVVAIKEAGGCVDRVTQLRAACDLPILSGDDGLTLPMLSMGAVGSISVVANIAPRNVEDMNTAHNEGRPDEARAIHEELAPLTRALFLETNPVPVKSALASLGVMTREVRLPLVAASSTCQQAVMIELERCGLLAGHMS